MKKFKRMLKIFLLAFLIILATVGVAITGVAPTFRFFGNRNKKEEAELVEEKDEEEMASLGEEKKS